MALKKGIIARPHCPSGGLEPYSDGNYYPWGSRMMAEELSIDGQKIAGYFPLQKSIEGMPHIFGELFGSASSKLPLRSAKTSLPHATAKA